MDVVTGSSARGVLTAAATALLALASVWYWPMLLVLLAGAVLFTAGWSQLLGLPNAAAARTVVSLVAVAAGAVVWFGRPGDLVVVLGLGVGASFLAEMLRRDGRPRLVESVAGTVTGSAVIASGALWLGLGDGRLAMAVVLTATAGLAAGAACTALAARPQVAATVATFVAGAAGLVAGVMLPGVGVLVGLLTGLAAGILTSATHLLFGRLPTASRSLPALSVTMLPLLLAGAPTFILGSTIIG